MQLSHEGLELIRHFEGLYLKAYKCPANVWTIGYGHTAMAGPPDVKPGMTITKDEAEKLLIKDLQKYADAVRSSVKRKLSDNQFSALVSFCFNVGIAGFRKSSVLKAVNEGRDDLVPSRLALWNKGGGRVLPGLIRRRAAEGDLYLSNVIDETVHASTKVEPSQGKPILASTTNIAAIGAATATVAQVTTDIAVIKDNAGPMLFAVLAGVAVLVFVGYIIYERVNKSRSEGV